MYDIIFISYNEPHADDNWISLKNRFPYAKRVNGIKGIHQAHIEAAKIANTTMFWVVDADAIIVDSFDFSYIPSLDEQTYVHVYTSINPINDLQYGYGGVKLLPKELTINMNVNNTDMTTSISKNFKLMNEISNITAFNTGPFETWKSAFRECAKLASKIIVRQNDEETNERLETWTTVGHDREFGEYAIRGARAGMEFGLSSGNDIQLINDFEWLKEKFSTI